jgi:DNA-nicking Smr family endonuclease
MSRRRKKNRFSETMWQMPVATPPPATSTKNQLPDDPFADHTPTATDPLFLEALENMPKNLQKLKKDHEPKREDPKPRCKQEASKVAEIDLHGYPLRVALEKVDQFIARSLYVRHKGQRGPKDFKIITGKGRHSGDRGGVLNRAVYQHIVTMYRQHIVRIDDPPAQSMLNGLPLRGYFLVTLQ